jgi:predicted cobalt transporter CbtA
LPVGLALLILPHAVGAPHPDALGGSVPPELAGAFVAKSIVVSAIFWSVLGWLAGGFFKRFTS